MKNQQRRLLQLEAEKKQLEYQWKKSEEEKQKLVGEKLRAEQEKKQVMEEKLRAEEENRRLEGRQKIFPDFMKDELIDTKILGSGSYASVCACKFRDKIGSYAVKIFRLPEDVQKRKAIEKSFQIEIETLKNTHHDNIVGMLGYRTTAKELFLFMELFDCNLTTIINTKTARQRDFGSSWFSVDQIKQFSIDIARGLHYLHKRSIAHRDIKVSFIVFPSQLIVSFIQTENVLVRLIQLETVKSLHIADFGTARQMVESEMAGTMIGTPGCLAPEVLASKYDPFKADSKSPCLWSFFMLTMCSVYSFGILLLELLGGQRTTKGQPVMDSKLKHNFKNNPKADALFLLFADCTSRQPDKRPSSSQVFLTLEEL